MSHSFYGNIVCSGWNNINSKLLENVHSQQQTVPCLSKEKKDYHGQCTCKYLKIISTIFNLNCSKSTNVTKSLPEWRKIAFLKL